MMALAQQGKPAFLWLLPPEQILAIVPTLQQQGWNIQAADAAGWNALMYACFAGRGDVVECLLKHGAKPSAPLPARDAGPVNDLVHTIWLLAPDASIETDPRSGLALSPDSPAMQDFVNNPSAHHALQSLQQAHICPSILNHLSTLSGVDGTLERALAGSGQNLTPAQQKFMRAGLLDRLTEWSVAHEQTSLVHVTQFTAPVNARLQKLVDTQIGKLAAIGEIMELAMLNADLTQALDLCVESVADLPVNGLQDLSVRQARRDILLRSLTTQAGLYAPLAACVSQAWQSALDVHATRLTLSVTTSKQPMGMDADGIRMLHKDFAAAIQPLLQTLRRQQVDLLSGASNQVQLTFAHLLNAQIHGLEVIAGLTQNAS